jgi:translation initiation factor 1A
MRKKVWVNVGDIVLVSLRDFQDERGDIILKYFCFILYMFVAITFFVVRYNPDEARQLKALGELPDCTKINEMDDGLNNAGDDDDDIEFQENEGINIEDVGFK